MQIFVVFFLWSSVFSDPSRELFGYNRDKILTYVFGILILRALVFSARTVDVSGEITSGNIMTNLLKPINYFKYWLTRDLSSKTLNIGFAAVETLILYYFLRPPFFVQTNLMFLTLFCISVVVAILMFFFLLMIVNLTGFWAPDLGWAGKYLVIVILTEFLSGGVFPIDVLPQNLQQIIYALPFPYLLFFPLQVYLGKLTLESVFFGLLVAIIWLVFLTCSTRYLWHKGLKHYEAFGK